MFEVKIKKHGKVKVNFCHLSNDREEFGGGKWRNHTTCEIWKQKHKKTDRPLYFGSTTVHPNDQYDKEFGRKLSLTRAIAELPRSERTKIWKAYFEAKKPLDK